MSGDTRLDWKKDNMRLAFQADKVSPSDIVRQMIQAGNMEKSVGMRRFFKTGPGQYGEGDQFIGLTTPQVRWYAAGCRQLGLVELDELLRSCYHEARAMALVVLIRHYDRGDETAQEAIFDFYLGHTKYINNWDLVDISAPNIVGAHLLDNDRCILRKLAAADSLWEQRIAVVSTLALIRRGEFTDTLQLVETLLDHPHDLMHKACGWMLREVGKRNRDILTAFLMKHKSAMPRTMLRYAIEHYPEVQRKAFLAK
ncbi:MAG: DNA alkylation repair protein [Victivallaceae bacterium]|nr:DNA alkylation repair protein [Victivallaceae bacterium]